MTNDELVAAVEQAHRLVRNTAPIEQSHADLVKHLRELLLEQERRAKEKPE